jgi:hypothetical protein
MLKWVGEQPTRSGHDDGRAGRSCPAPGVRRDDHRHRAGTAGAVPSGAQHPLGLLPDPTGAANLTGVTVDDAYAAFRALQKAGLAIPSSTNPRRNGWRLDADNLAIAAGQHPTSWTRD